MNPREAVARALEDHEAFVSRSTAIAFEAAAADLAADEAVEKILVGEGDSWFAYPGSNVLDSLEFHFNYDVRSAASNGDTLEDIVYSPKQIDRLVRKLDKLRRRGKTPKALLLSAGGNDVAGKELEILLNHQSSGLEPVNQEMLRGLMSRLEAAWSHYFDIVALLTREIYGQEIPMLVHGYDYPVPDGRGFWSGFWFLPGPWLRPAFRKKGYAADPDNLEPEKQILRNLIDAYNEMLTAVTNPNDLVHYVHVRGTLRHDDDYREDWRDELHPTDDGFELVAAKFHEVLTDL